MLQIHAYLPSLFMPSQAVTQTVAGLEVFAGGSGNRRECLYKLSQVVTQTVAGLQK